MSEEPTNPSLDQLTEATAEAIIFTIGATTGDPKPAIIQLRLEPSQKRPEQTSQGAPREHHLEERGRQN